MIIELDVLRMEEVGMLLEILLLVMNLRVSNDLEENLLPNDIVVVILRSQT
jgi:hypothetical protein